MRNTTAIKRYSKTIALLLSLNILLGCQSNKADSPEANKAAKDLLVDKIWTLREIQLETKVTYKGQALDAYEAFNEEILPGQSKIIFRSDDTYHVFEKYATGARLNWEIKNNGKTIVVSYVDDKNSKRSVNLEEVLVTDKRLRFKYLHNDSKLTPSSFYVTAFGDAN